MKNLSFLIGLILYCLSFSTHADFKIYDGFLYKNKPDLRNYNIAPIPIIYESALLSSKDKNQTPALTNIINASRQINNSKIDKAVIDIERWPVTGNKNLVAQSVKKYQKVIQDLKASGTTKLIGYYGAPPVRDYWRAIKKPTSKEYISWQKDNDALQSLADTVDALYPSIYTFYDDQYGWVEYAKAQIKEARRLANGKPVIVFLWPKYHDSNKLLKNKYIPASFWRVQLETALAFADGAIIWGGWQETWDPNAEWWKETQDFIMDNGLNK
jgi:Hyaluronidase.